MPSSPAASGNPASDMLRLIAENWVAFAITFVVAAALQVYMFARKALKTKAWLNPEQYQPLRLAQKRNLNHNTLFLRFELPSPNMRLGLPIGQHISFMAKDDDGKVRPPSPHAWRVRLEHARVYGKHSRKTERVGPGGLQRCPCMLPASRSRAAKRRNSPSAMVCGGPDGEGTTRGPRGWACRGQRPRKELGASIGR
eukprot:363363-Chlamydomonas_euryale.AAC.4